MKATKETYMAAVKFASLQGYDFVRYAAVYKNFVAYYVTSKTLEDSCSVIRSMYWWIVIHCVANTGR